MDMQNIGRYEIERELGQGGMAMVYLARDPYIKRKVAIKVLHRQDMSSQTIKAGFLREAESVATLEHPFIVPIYDFGEEDGANFIVMRLMLGGTLTNKITKRQAQTFLPVEIINILQRVGSALDSAHLQGIVHRDLKPDNILYDRYKGAFLGDFGIAHLMTDDESDSGVGMVLGTPAYMSPEQFDGEAVDGRSDLYALGVIAFELLTGRQPYEGSTLMELMTKHITEPIPRILDFNSHLSPACQQVIQKAMAKNPNDRYDTAGEMVAALASALMDTYSSSSATLDIPLASLQSDLFTKATSFITTLNDVVKEQAKNNRSTQEIIIDNNQDDRNFISFTKASHFIAALDEVNRMNIALGEASKKDSDDITSPTNTDLHKKLFKQIHSLSVRCPNCAAKIKPEQSDCPQCGTSLVGSLSFH